MLRVRNKGSSNTWVDTIVFSLIVFYYHVAAFTSLCVLNKQIFTTWSMSLSKGLCVCSRCEKTKICKNKSNKELPLRSRYTCLSTAVIQSVFTRLKIEIHFGWNVLTVFTAHPIFTTWLHKIAKLTGALCQTSENNDSCINIHYLGQIG